MKKTALVVTLVGGIGGFLPGSVTNAYASSISLTGSIIAFPGGFLSCGDGATPGTLPTCQMSVRVYNVGGTLVVNPTEPVDGELIDSYSAAVSAVASANDLGILVGASGFGTQSGVTISASGYASFDDYLTISGGVGTGYLLITGGFDGDISGSGFNGGTSNGSALYQLVSFGAGQSGELCYATTNSPTPSSSCSALLPFTFGAPFELQQNFDVGAGIGINPLGGLTATAGVTADFFHTAGISNLTVFDSNMNALANASISAQSGYQYPEGPTPVPEPGTFTLLTLGLAGFLVRLSWIREG